MRSDQFYMKAALRQAAKAEAEDETPIGAVIVKDGKIIARGRNAREARQDVTLHAEMTAIRQACRKLGSWRLEGCTLYVTLEPCLMCAGAIIQSRIDRVVFGAADPKAGAAGSVTNAFTLKSNHAVCLKSGVLASDCSEILKRYFRHKRRQNKALGSRGSRRSVYRAARLKTPPENT